MSLGGKKLHSVAVHVEPVQYLAGWRADAGTLFLATLSEGRVGEQAAVRIGLVGQTLRATVFGSISRVRRVGRPSLPPGIDLQLDRRSLPAAHFLALAARGEPFSFRERPPRYLVERKLRVKAEGGPEREADTHNLSAGGCALAWAGGAPPGLGSVLAIKLGGAFFAASTRAVVCWVAPDGAASHALGLGVVGEGRGARVWRALAEEAVAAGARAV
ncbi:MAG TPA: PilZ domain-containing protein [Anaeromyxobacteraceae bacterium]|nr:PilZ domain-containing protein [Anaeromyxobacteraceae bacterium]